MRTGIIASHTISHYLHQCARNNWVATCPHECRLQLTQRDVPSTRGVNKDTCCTSRSAPRRVTLRVCGPTQHRTSEYRRKGCASRAWPGPLALRTAEDRPKQVGSRGRRRACDHATCVCGRAHKCVQNAPTQLNCPLHFPAHVAEGLNELHAWGRCIACLGVSAPPHSDPTCLGCRGCRGGRASYHLSVGVATLTPPRPGRRRRLP